MRKYMEYGTVNSMKVVLGSVVYQGALSYLEDFLRSVDKQVDCEFSLLLLNDNMDPMILKKKVSKYSFQADIMHFDNKTPVQLRIELLKQAKCKNVDLLIIGDCDDFFSNTRMVNTIHASIENPEYTFFYNELRDMRGMNIMPMLPECIEDFREIGEYNFLGLSNTAINMREISNEFIDSLKEYQYEIFDWYLFSRLLLERKSGKRVDNCFTVYRLHENNIAGVQKFDEYNIKREIEVKRKHYSSLRKYHKYYGRKYASYQQTDGFQYLSERQKYFWWNLLKVNE